MDKENIKMVVAEWLQDSFDVNVDNQNVDWDDAFEELLDRLDNLIDLSTT